MVSQGEKGAAALPGLKKGKIIKYGVFSCIRMSFYVIFNKEIHALRGLLSWFFFFFLPLFAGVPQGTKLGPIAFQAVINDAAVGGTVHYWKYVDDLTFAENRLSSELSNLQGDLDDFLDWSVTNQLKLNPTKSQALQICFMRDLPPCPDLKIGQSVLAFVSSAKVLGVWLQNDLKWDTQVNYMNKNAAKRLFMLRSLKRFGFSKSELVTVLRVTFVPCSNILMLFGIRVSLPIRPTGLKEFKKGLWELFLVLIIFHMLICFGCMWCWSFICPEGATYCSLKFAQSLPKCSRTSKLLPPCRGEIHGSQLRNNAKLTQPRARTNRYACSPIPYYVELINSKLPYLDFLLSIFFFARLLHSLALFLCCLLLYFKLCFWSYCVFFFFSCLNIVHCNSALGPQFCANKLISYHIS